MRPRAALSLLLTLLAVARAERAAACATAPPPGTTVQIAEEEAIIAWDARTHVETFIRRAAFHATGPRFGFLVPTPTTPTLGEVDAGVFAAIAEALGPERVIDRSGYQLGVTSWAASCLASHDKADHAPMVATAGPNAVRVLRPRRSPASTRRRSRPTIPRRWPRGWRPTASRRRRRSPRGSSGT